MSVKLRVEVGAVFVDKALISNEAYCNKEGAVLREMNANYQWKRIQMSPATVTHSFILE